MEQNTTTTARTALKFGLITGVAYIIYTTILYVSGQAANTALGWLGMIISITGMVFAMKEYREDNSGFMTYGEGLGIGTMMSAVSGLLAGTYGYIYNTFIDPTMRQQIMDKVRTDMENKGMDDDKIDQAMQMTEKFSSPGMTFLFSIVGAIFIGFLISLIISAIMRKNKPFDFQ
jgi:Protein of unknown function (DUF4199)